MHSCGINDYYGIATVLDIFFSFYCAFILNPLIMNEFANIFLSCFWYFRFEAVFLNVPIGRTWMSEGTETNNNNNNNRINYTIE